MSGHICTTDSLFAGAIELPASNCPICCNTCKADAGYIGVRCKGCGSVWDTGMTMPDIVRRRRELMGLNRREMSFLSGYSKSTIKKYEFVRCTDNYYKKTEELIKNERTQEKTSNLKT